MYTLLIDEGQTKDARIQSAVQVGDEIEGCLLFAICLAQEMRQGVGMDNDRGHDHVRDCIMYMCETFGDIWGHGEPWRSTWEEEEPRPNATSFWHYFMACCVVAQQTTCMSYPNLSNSVPHHTMSYPIIPLLCYVDVPWWNVMRLLFFCASFCSVFPSSSSIEPTAHYGPILVTMLLSSSTKQWSEEDRGECGAANAA